MKRFAIVGLLITLIITCILVHDKEKAEARPAEVSSAKPVIVPYMNKTITECQQSRQDASESQENEKMITTMGDEEKGKEEAENGPEADRSDSCEVEPDSDVAGESDPEAEGNDSEGGSDADVDPGSKTYLGEWRVTFYCPCEICCGEWANGITSSGAVATPWWTVACDGLADGTIIEIDGLGTFEVQDSGVPYGCVDVFVADHEEALQLGERWADIYVVEQ